MAWTLYETKIIHSYRIMQLGSYTFLNAQTPDKSLAERYQKLHRLTFPNQMTPMFSGKGLRLFKPLKQIRCLATNG
jgi:hypothetical protein